MLRLFVGRALVFMFFLSTVHAAGGPTKGSSSSPPKTVVGEDAAGAIAEGPGSLPRQPGKGKLKRFSGTPRDNAPPPNLLDGTWGIHKPSAGRRVGHMTLKRSSKSSTSPNHQESPLPEGSLPASQSGIWTELSSPPEQDLPAQQSGTRTESSPPVPERSFPAQQLSQLPNPRTKLQYTRKREETMKSIGAKIPEEDEPEPMHKDELGQVDIPMPSKPDYEHSADRTQLTITAPTETGQPDDDVTAWGPTYGDNPSERGQRGLLSTSIPKSDQRSGEPGSIDSAELVIEAEGAQQGMSEESMGGTARYNLDYTETEV